MSAASDRPPNGFAEKLLAKFVGASIPQARVVILASIVATQFLATFLAVGLVSWLQTSIVQGSYADSARASEARYARQRQYLDRSFASVSAQCARR